jgi:dTDP-4-dehydrorhamnose reductase
MSKSDQLALITGGAGLLARSLANLLISNGWRVEALNHSQLDITDQAAVTNAVDRVRPNVVFNCAATADVDRCELDPQWAFDVNERGPQHLAQACRQKRSQLVHVSTDYVFDGEKEGFYTQEDEPLPLSVYGASKLAGERAAAGNLDSCYVIRSSWIFGAGGKNFGSRVVEYAKSGASLKGVADQVSIPTYAPDLARRIQEIVQRGVFGLYHVTSSGPATWLEYARLALDLAGLEDVPIQPVNRADLNQSAPRPRNSAMSCLLSANLGFEPLRHWKDALQEFISEMP